jgi:DNA-binding CsgD family transcriptional regulator
LEGLTPAESEIVQLIVQGRSTKEIAKTLSRGTSTVDFHRNNIRQKLGLTHRGKNLQQHLNSLN